MLRWKHVWDAMTAPPRYLDSILITHSCGNSTEAFDGPPCIIVMGMIITQSLTDSRNFIS